VSDEERMRRDFNGASSFDFIISLLFLSLSLPSSYHRKSKERERLLTSQTNNTPLPHLLHQPILERALSKKVELDLVGGERDAVGSEDVVHFDEF